MLEIGDLCLKAKTCLKPLAQLSCCSKLESKHFAELSFSSKLATFVKELKLVPNTVRNCPVICNWPFDRRPVGKRAHDFQFT